MSDEQIQIHELLTSIDGRLDRIEDDVKGLRKILVEGNGTPAMTVRVAVLENELTRVKEEREDQKVPRAVWLGIIISVVMGLLSLGMAASG